MTRKEFKRVLKTLGWKEHRQEGGGPTYYVLPDRLLTISVIINYILKQNGEYEFVMDFGEAVTTHKLAMLCEAIEGRKTGSLEILCRRRPVVVRRAPSITEADVHNISDDMIDWAKSVNLEAALRWYLEVNDAAGPGYLLNRFIAMKMYGQEAELEAILARLERGERGSFIPFVTPELIRNVLSLDVSQGI